MVCPTCGRISPPNARHCRTCGESLEATPEAGPVGAEQGTQPGQSTALPPGSILNGRYRIEQVIGTGAFGRVYMAEDTQDPNSTPLAIKELLATEFTSSEEQFEAFSWFKREVGTLLALDHPGIPAIHGYWTAKRTGGAMYLVMDYIPGKTMAEVQAAFGGKVPWQHAVSWGVSLCDVLYYLHSRIPPYIFRDLKPANVMLDSRTNSPVLIDFGLARQLVPVGLTAVGTWGYVSYEQVLGKAEPRSDLYALGAILHALISGRQPDAEYRRLLRTGLDVEGAMRALFPPLEGLVAGLPHRLSAVVDQATAFAIEDRFADADAMMLALQRVLGTTEALSETYLPSNFPVPGSAQPAQPTQVLGAYTTKLAPIPQPPMPPPTPGSLTIGGPVIQTTVAAQQVQPSTPPTPLPSMSQPAAQPTMRLGPEIVGTHAAFAAPPGGAQQPPLPVLSTNYDSLPTLQPETSVAQPLAYQPFPTSVPTPVQSGAPVVPTPVTPASNSAARRGLPWWNGRTAKNTPIPTSAPGVYTVSARGDAQFTSIGAAILQAAPGSRIEIAPGHYREPLIIDRELEIVGVGAVDQILVEAENVPALLMHAEAAQVKGVTFRYWAATGDMKQYAVNIPMGKLVMEDCRVISNSLACVAIHRPGTDPVLRRCAIKNVGERGLMIYEHARATLEECDIAGNTLAVRITVHAEPVLRSCRLHDARLGGVVFSGGAGGMLDGCEIINNGHHGVTITRNSAPVIRRCRISNNGWSGISISDTSGAVVEHCDLRGNVRSPWEVPFSAKQNLRAHHNREAD